MHPSTVRKHLYGIYSLPSPNLCGKATLHSLKLFEGICFKYSLERDACPRRGISQSEVRAEAEIKHEFFTQVCKPLRRRRALVNQSCKYWRWKGLQDVESTGKQCGGVIRRRLSSWAVRDREMAQLVQYSPWRHKDRNLISRTQERKPGFVACNPGTGETETGGS